MRKALSVVGLALAAVLASVPAVALDYQGSVEFRCDGFNASGTGSAILDRDNTGAGEELITLEVFDGGGALIYEDTFQNGLAEYTGGLAADQLYAIAPQYNPLALYATSHAGNGFDEEVTLLGVGECDAIGVVPETAGLVDVSSGTWILFDESGNAQSTFYYGNPFDLPIMGDWDGDGIATPGMYRVSDGYVYLRNSNTQGIADIRFFFGNPGDTPIVGDFDGDGFDTVSIYRASEGRFYIINKLGANEGGLGAAEMSYLFGDVGDRPFVGDFDGDGIDTVGLHRESTGLVYFRNSHTQGIAHAQFIYGDPGDRIMAGDWDGDGIDTPALFRPGTRTLYFNNENEEGPADFSFSAGGPLWLPVGGRR